MSICQTQPHRGFSHRCALTSPMVARVFGLGSRHMLIKSSDARDSCLGQSVRIIFPAMASLTVGNGEDLLNEVRVRTDKASVKRD
jgi:hypothetical protein